MRELGEYLKQMRETQGLSIRDVSEKVKIREKYIEALEESNFEVLPPEIYVKGYIKTYGELLGADLDDLFARYEESKPKKAKVSLFQRTPSKPKPKFIPKKNNAQDGLTGEKESHSSAPKSGSSIKSIEESGFKPIYLIYILISIVLIIVMVYVIKINSSKPDIPDESNKPFDPGNSGVEAQVIEMPFTYEELTQEVILPMGDINPTWAIGRADSLNIAIKVRKEAWCRVESDYEQMYKGFIRPSKPLEFKAKNSFYLTLKDPELFAMTLNGFELVPCDEFKRIVGAHPNATQIEVDINRSNVTKFLKGMTEITLPSYMPSIPEPESLAAMQARQAAEEKPKTATRKTNTRPRPNRKKATTNTTTANKTTNNSNKSAPNVIQPKKIEPKTSENNPDSGGAPPLKPRGG